MRQITIACAQSLAIPPEPIAGDTGRSTNVEQVVAWETGPWTR